MNRIVLSGRTLLLTVALAAVLALTGCVQVEVSSEFDSEGGAHHAITSTLDQSMIDDEMLDTEFQ